MTVACYPLDAVAGAPEYTGRMLRDTLAALVGGASATRPLGAFSGVRPGTPSTTVALSGLDWTCEPHAGVLDVQAAAEAGPYLYAVLTDETGTLDAQAVGNARSDLLVAQLSDPAEADGTSVPKVEIVYVAGTAGPGAPDPATPARSMILARFNVPQSGGGSPTVTWLAPALYAAGARPSVATVAALATLEEYTNMEATVESTPGAFWKYDGSTWVMYGTARFASAATRTTALTAPVAGMRTYLVSTKHEYEYSGSAWTPLAGRLALAGVNTGGAVAANADGSLTPSGAITVLRVNTLLTIAELALFTKIELDIDIYGSTAGAVNFGLADGATIDVTASSYKADRVYAGGGVVTAATQAAATVWSFLNLANRRVARFTLTFKGMANNAIGTMVEGTGEVQDIDGANLLTIIKATGFHIQNDDFNGWNLVLTGFGTVSQARVSARGVL